MIPAFSNVTEDAYTLLQRILENPGLTPADFFFDEPTVDGQIILLEQANLVRLDDNTRLYITELGRAALKEHDHAILQRHSQKIWNILCFAVPTLISICSLIISCIKN